MTFSEQFIQIMDEVFRRVGIIVDWTSQNVAPYLVQSILQTTIIPEITIIEELMTLIK